VWSLALTAAHSKARLQVQMPATYRPYLPDEFGPLSDHRRNRQKQKQQFCLNNFARFESNLNKQGVALWHSGLIDSL